MFEQSVLDHLDDLAGRYRSAEPFPHVVVDNFFEAAYAEQLLREFPAFDPELAMGDMGKVGPKAVNKKMRAISPFYNAFCDFLVSDQFLTAIERITGIEDLISLPDQTGGTHDSRTGAVLAPHLDYNYFGENPPLHRRLNILFYLNKDWQSEWGGNLQLHSNPRNWAENKIVSNAPLFNRCVIMETSEHSWHGYDPISIPADVEASRKSISIYLFTRTRPAEQTAPRHSTFYVQPPLPEKFQAGRTLTNVDCQELRSAMAKRDNWINFYQNEVLRHSGRADNQKKRAEQLHEGISRAVSLLDAGDSHAARAELLRFSRGDSKAFSGRTTSGGVRAAIRKLLRGKN